MIERTLGPISLERMVRAVEKVRERLLRTAAVFQNAGNPYAIAGGNAVAAWVSRIDEAAVRNTQYVDVLMRRDNLPAAIVAMEQAGFVHRHSAGIDKFLDGPDAKFRDAVHVLFAAEKVREEYNQPAPEISEAEDDHNFRVVTLDALVRMKLTSFRRKDQVHLLDMLDVGLIDVKWCGRLPAKLADRLQELIDDPEANCHSTKKPGIL